MLAWDHVTRSDVLRAIKEYLDHSVTPFRARIVPFRFGRTCTLPQ